ncbi:O-antigen translocase [Flavobacteriaceae bacterium XHP0103]|uniref:O-antigen translocase n=1 Tax=Marixanthotalea marina TaxID=2844359 RepID=UPI002989B93C|nr:O-antigen translocase [Marixanthotalea marina]MBU3821169.1 O-antigen translocase [Marixanthotalea marina]
MKKFIDYIRTKVLVKVTSLKTTSVIVKIIAGILTSKAIALFVGATGLALIGNMRNFVSATQTFATLGFYNGIVKHVAKFKEDALNLSKTLSTVFYVGFVTTIMVSFFCYFKADFINATIFPGYNNYVYIIRIFAIVLPFYALNVFSFSIMNGFSKYKILIIINIIGQILSVSITLLLIYQNRIDGALISVAISESIIFLITLVGIINRRSLAGYIKVKEVSLTFLKTLSPFSVMALFSAIILPLVALAIRSYLIENLGYREAGFWEAMTRISKYYLMLVVSLMTLYVLPRFSEIDSVEEFKKEVFNIYKSIMPMFALGLLVIYLLRQYIVLFIFSEEFKPVSDLFLWQLLGDLLKVLSMVITYQFLAKKMYWHFIITEVFFLLILYMSSIYFIDLFGIKGAVIGHFVSYFMYYAIILLILRSSLFRVDSENYKS